jgi:hypothetical protein
MGYVDDIQYKNVSKFYLSLTAVPASLLLMSFGFQPFREGAEK